MRLSGELIFIGRIEEKFLDSFFQENGILTSFADDEGFVSRLSQHRTERVSCFRGFCKCVNFLYGVAYFLQFISEEIRHMFADQKHTVSNLRNISSYHSMFFLRQISQLSHIPQQHTYFSMGEKLHLDIVDGIYDFSHAEWWRIVARIDNDTFFYPWEYA